MIMYCIMIQQFSLISPNSTIHPPAQPPTHTTGGAGGAIPRGMDAGQDPSNMPWGGAPIPIEGEGEGGRRPGPYIANAYGESPPARCFYRFVTVR